MHVRELVNSSQLTKILNDFAREYLRNGDKAVLFPTSDTMVRSIGESWPELEQSFLLSWSSKRNSVLNLLLKTSLPAICSDRKILHPPTLAVTGTEDCESIADALGFPLLLKPARPLSSFKALLIDSNAELDRVIRTYEKDLPYVAQQWIDGGDDSLYFCSLFLEDGVERAYFCGRKLRSHPRGLGQGTVMTAEENEDVLALSRKFLDGMNWTGPISIEFKRDRSGHYWLIEPNVGRTEYCVDLAIQAGVNLPFIEYCAATGRSCDVVRAKPKPVTWFDTEKDPLCYLKTVTAAPLMLLQRPVFPYLSRGDQRPFRAAITNRLSR